MTKSWWAGRKFWLGLVCSAVFLFLAVRQADWAETIATLRPADLRLIGLGTALLLATFVVFAFRWRILLSASARLSVGDTFSYIMIGYLADTVLPLRLGDVARAALIGKRHGLSASLVLGSVLLERTLDVLTVLVLALGLSFIVDIPPVVRAGMTTLAGGALIALVGLFLLARNENRLPGLVARLPGFVPRASLQHLIGLIVRFAGGLRTLRDGRQLGQVLLLSGLAWALAGVGTICWVVAFHLPVPWYAGLFVLAVINLGAAIPSSPGGHRGIPLSGGAGPFRVGARQERGAGVCDRHARGERGGERGPGNCRLVAQRIRLRTIVTLERSARLKLSQCASFS